MKPMIRPALAVPLALLATIVVLAAPAHADDDRVVLKLSGFQADARLGVGVRGAVIPDDYATALRDGASLHGTRTRPHVQLRVRLSLRQRLLADYYDYAQSRTVALDQIDVDESIGTAIPAGSRARFGIGFALASVMYEYAPLDTGAVQLGLGLGVTHARLGAAASATVGSHSGRLRDSVDGYAPTFGVRLHYAPGDRWRLGAEVQGFDTGWGNLAVIDGHFERAGVSIEYRVTRNVGVHLGYDWFQLTLHERIGADAIQLRVSGALRVRGPTAGIALAF